jgi:Secretion system C-terminal sorting domain
LPVYMSEFDIDEPNDSIQLAQHQIYFPIFWEDPGVKGMTLWGYIQNNVWNTHPNTYLLRTDGSERPALQWLRHYVQKGPVPTVPLLVLPGVISNAPKRPTYVWQAALHATTYKLQVALDNAFPLVLIDTTVADTAATPSAVLDDTTIFYWRVCGIDSAGAGPFSSTGHFTTGTLLVVKGAPSVLREYSLSQNYPNPFNPTTQISYQTPVNGLVTLKVYDVLGQEVRTLVNGQKNAGAYTVQFDGSGPPSGVYFYRIQAGKFVSMKKLLLVK